MAIDFGSSNPSRYYTVPDHADFTLPDSDWTWTALVEFNGTTSFGNYIVSTGDWGAANSFNLYTYGISAGTAVKVAALTEIWLTTEPLVAGKPYWIYAVRRGGVLRAGQIAVGGSSASESASTSITGSFNSGTGPYLGNRAAGLVRPWNGRWSQIAFISGAGITVDQVAELARGAPLLSMPFAPQIKALWHGRNASSSGLVDLIGGKFATKQGTGYGTNEEDAQTPYIWVPEYVRAVPASSGVTGSVAYTNADDTASASGSPVIVGNLAVSNANDPASASGSVGSAVSGSVSYTNQSDTVAASGTTTVTGSSATTNADDTASASGSVGSAATGSVNYTNADDAASAAGTTAVVGSVSATNAEDSAAATGTTTVVGSVAAVNANDSVFASGSIGSSVSGSVAYTNADDSIAASGTTTVTGTAGTANADDTAVASGEVVDVVTGSASVTNADDTAAAAGTITILGELLTLNRNDSAIASGMVNDGAVVESLLVSSVSRVKKPGIPNDAPAWLRTTLEILTGRRGNRIEVPKAKTLTFSATPTKEECEALYSHIQEVRDSLEQLINRQDS